MAIFGKKGESFLGIDFGAGGIKLVELHKTKGRPQLWTYGLSSVPLDIHIKAAEKKEEMHLPDKPGHKRKPAVEEEKKPKKENKTLDEQLADPRIDKYAGYLKQVLEQSKVTTRNATASLPVSHVFHAVVTLPKVDDKEIDHHVRAKIKKMLPQDIEDMQVVHQLIPTDNKDEKFIRLLVTAAPKRLVAFYTAIFQKAGLQLQALETEAFALERSLVGHDTSTAMIVDIGAERTNFFIIDQGLPITHRSIEMGGDRINKELQGILGIGDDITDQVKRDMSRISLDKIPEQDFEHLLEPIVKEIQYSFDLFLRQTGNENKHPQKIILTGGTSLFSPLRAYITKAFTMKVFVGDPWARVVYQQGLKPILDANGPRMAVCIGLSLRNMMK